MRVMAADVHVEWGREAIDAHGQWARTIVIVDVLRFSSAVVAGVEAGATIEPTTWKGERTGPGSLSPTQMDRLEPGTHVVLPSPNGATLSLAASETGARVIAGCLRNASAAALAAAAEPPVLIVAAGERWKITEGTLRPAIEDYLGAAAIASHIEGLELSPEARLAVAAFGAVRDELPDLLATCESGRELYEKGYADDVTWAATLDVSETVPYLGWKRMPPSTRMVCMFM